MGAFDRGGDFAQQLLQVFVAVDEINFRSIDDQQVRRRVVKEEMFVGLDHFFQVLVIDRFLIGGILLSKALFQNFGRGLQVNDEVGSGKLIAEMIVVAVIGIEFLIGQIEAGEKLVFFEDKIGDYDLL